MAEKIIWNLSIQVAGGPHLVGSATAEVEAYDVIEVVVPETTTNTPIEVAVVPSGTEETEPTGGAGVAFLCISLRDAEQYGAHGISYSAGAPNATSSERSHLDAMQFFGGAGAVGLIMDPTTLFFYNELREPSSVRILVGRKATR